MTSVPSSQQLPTVSCGLLPERGVQAAVWRSLRLAGVHLDTPGALEIAYSLSWLVRQQPKILHRFEPSQNDKHTLEGFGVDDYWPRKLDMYFSRVRILTLESPQGRQAVAELAATCLGLLASVWRTSGPPASDDEDWSDQAAVLRDAVKKE